MKKLNEELDHILFADHDEFVKRMFELGLVDGDDALDLLEESLPEEPDDR